jgi:hypothetical protein
VLNVKTSKIGQIGYLSVVNEIHENNATGRQGSLKPDRGANVFGFASERVNEAIALFNARLGHFLE